MEKQRLPNSTVVLLLGILSIPTCCCWGIGVLLGVIALVLAKKDTKLYVENPELYKGYDTINTGKVIAIIGIVLGAIFLIFAIYLHTNYTEAELIEMQQNLQEKLNHQQEMDS